MTWASSLDIVSLNLNSLEASFLLSLRLALFSSLELAATFHWAKTAQRLHRTFGGSAESCEVKSYETVQKKI